VAAAAVGAAEGGDAGVAEGSGFGVIEATRAGDVDGAGVATCGSGTGEGAVLAAADGMAASVAVGVVMTGSSAEDALWMLVGADAGGGEGVSWRGHLTATTARPRASTGATAHNAAGRTQLFRP
jgi:hypothetical protein